MYTLIHLISILWYSFFPKKNKQEDCQLFYGGRCVSGDICGCKPIPKDPVKHCNVYKRDGCAHVDGPLCDVDTCAIVKKDKYGKNVITIKPIEK